MFIIYHPLSVHWSPPRSHKSIDRLPGSFKAFSTVTLLSPFAEKCLWGVGGLTQSPAFSPLHPDTLWPLSPFRSALSFPGSISHPLPFPKVPILHKLVFLKALKVPLTLLESKIQGWQPQDRHFISAPQHLAMQTYI